MKTFQTNLIKMANMAIDLFTENAVIVALIAGLLALIEEVKTLLAEITKQVELQNITSKEATEKTKEIKTDMVGQGDFVLKELKAYATVIKDPSIYANIDFTEYEMLKMSNEKAKETVVTIYNKAVSLSAELVDYNVTETVLSNLKAAIDLLTTYMNKTKQAIIDRSVATQTIDDYCEKLKDYLDNMDILIDPFEKSQPEFYSKYQSIRDMNATRTYFTSVQITVVDAVSGKPLQGVTISCVHESNSEANATFVTNKYGRNRKEKLISGNYINTYVLPGYITQTGKMAIIDDQTAIIEIKMIAS